MAATDDRCHKTHLPSRLVERGARGLPDHGINAFFPDFFKEKIESFPVGHELSVIHGRVFVLIYYFQGPARVWKR